MTEQRAIGTGNASCLIRRYAVTGAHQAIVRIAGTGHNRSIQPNLDGLRRVIARLVKVRHVVGNGVHRLQVLIAHADFQAQLRGNFPAILHEKLRLGEPEKADWIGAGFRVASEIA